MAEREGPGPMITLIELTIRPGIEWHELIRLLEILSVRYTGIHQNEDDIVTLLWRASFEHVDVDAVEGFVSEGDARAKRIPVVRAPQRFDLPAPALEQTRALAFRVPSDRKLRALHAEASSGRIAPECVRLVGQLIDACERHPTLLGYADLLPLVHEIRDFLLSDEYLEELLSVHRLLRTRVVPAAKDLPELEPLLAGFTDQAAIARLIRSIPVAVDEPSLTLVELLRHSERDPLPLLLRLLEEEPVQQRRVVIGRIISHLAPNAQDAIAEYIRRSNDTVARLLMGALILAVPEAARTAAVDLAARSDPGVQLDCLTALEGGPYDNLARSVLFALLQSRHDGIRAQALDKLAAHKDPRNYPIVLRHARARAELSDFTYEEAEQIAATLHTLSAANARALFAEWAETKGVFRKQLTGLAGEHWIAIAGLAQSADDAADALLLRFIELSEDERTREYAAYAREVRLATLGRIAPETVRPAPVLPAAALDPIASSLSNGDGLDPFTAAQERLGHALDVARAGEDKELAGRVRELGEMVVHRLVGAIRMTHLYVGHNEALDGPLKDLHDALEQMLDLLGVVRVVAVEDQVYVNDVRIRFRMQTDAPVVLRESLERHEAGGLAVHQALPPAALERLANLLGGERLAKPGEALDALGLQLAEDGLESIELLPPFRLRSQWDASARDRPFEEVYTQGLDTLRETCASVSARRLPNPLSIRRVVTDLVDLVDARPDALLHAPNLGERTHAEGSDLVEHSMTVATLATLIGHAVGLTPSALSDLAVAAVFHDIGYAVEPDETAGSPAPTLETHHIEGVRQLLRQRGFHTAKIRRLVVCLNHHQRDDADPKPLLFSRIVHIADDYDTLTRRRPGAPALAPYDAIRRMMAAAGSVYDATLLQLFVNRMGAFPPGSKLSLEDGRWVESVSGARSGATFAKPVCKLLRHADGTPCNEPVVVDLAREGRVTGLVHDA